MKTFPRDLHARTGEVLQWVEQRYYPTTTSPDPSYEGPVDREDVVAALRLAADTLELTDYANRRKMTAVAAERYFHDAHNYR